MRVPAIDDTKSPALASQLQGIRGGMVGAAEKMPLPSRFAVTPCTDAPRLTIRDIETGRETTIGLCDYYGARKVLGDLFGEAGQ